MSHYIGAPPVTDTLVPLTGWSLTGADLRPAHFSVDAHGAGRADRRDARDPHLSSCRSHHPSRSLCRRMTVLTIKVFTNALAGHSLGALLRL